MVNLKHLFFTNVLIFGAPVTNNSKCQTFNKQLVQGILFVNFQRL